MEQTVYVDLFFLINFSMDFLCFYLTSRLLSHRFSIARCAAASALGGVYACVSLFWGFSGIWTFLFDMVACFVMSGVAVLKRDNVKDIFGYSIVYTACSVVMGGAMTALFSLFNRLSIDKLLGESSEGDGISVWLFAILALISAVISLGGLRVFKKKSSRRIGQVELIYGGKSVALKALCDSGNMLTEPISSKPCIVAQSSEVKKILPSGMVEMIEKGISDRISARDIRRVRVVPAQTVNGGGILYAVRVDRIRLCMDRDWVDVDAYIALCELDKGVEGAQALVPSALAMGAP